eukprot:CAMPEP_0115125532 /NCGR_PEP_ID=MMETSP0227-20121206/49101_1 /TAXON_ID=89957 /ORGANISM="Polarella glacialis, Strain CCMP 1383" /LENGTH=188 /DNA_ID=CAMNT_0002528927 /DNA_START=191 /DNA_END=757 /DNA_ORIENTATION=-
MSRRGFWNLVPAAIAAAVPASVPLSVMAFGDMKMPMTNIRYEEVDCNADRGETLKGTQGSRGLMARCVEVTAQITNTEGKELTKVSVFGRINDPVFDVSVLANAVDGSSDVGQLTMIETVPEGTVDVKFRFVAAINKNRKDKPLPKLQFKSMKAIAYPGGLRWKKFTECDLNPTGDGCDPDIKLNTKF